MPADRALAAIDAMDADEAASMRAGRAAGEAMEEILALPDPLRGAEVLHRARVPRRQQCQQCHLCQQYE